MNDLAKSSGVLLDDHVRHLQEKCDLIFPSHTVACEKYQRLTGQDLDATVREAVRWHDEGKKHSQWQSACRKDYEESQRRGKSYGENLKRSGIRHELASLELAHKQKAALSLPVRAAIGAHHGKLSRRYEHRWLPDFAALWQEFSYLGNSFRVTETDAALLKRYEFAGPRALLQLADHRASASEELSPGDSLPVFAPFTYNFPSDWEKNGVQTIIETFWDEPFAILRAPTGAGKTDAALLWAKHQVEQGRAERLVIAMPTRFTANALAVSDPEAMSRKGLYHSSAWLDADRRELGLARLLETPITVTTIDHLCISLTGTKEDHHGIFFNLAHSCVVIDEADFYDDFTQQNIVMLLRALRLLDVRVLVMSATVPESARQVYMASGFACPKIYEDTSDAERARCRLTRFGKMETPSDVVPLLQRALDGEPTIIYANTVRRAQDYLRWFQARDCPWQVVLYHSRFTEPDKKKKEAELYAMLGKEAWANQDKGEGVVRGIAILTQIGELSVNISADLMISDLCPVDRLAQRVGRLSRFRTDKPGELFVVDPHQSREGESRLYPAPYGRWVGQGWEVGDALLKSDELLTSGDYSPRRFVELVNLVYPVPPELTTRVRDNKEALQKCIVWNWLILPKERVKEGDDDTKDWSSRDIAPQETVFVQYANTGIEQESDDAPRTWPAFRRFQMEHGVEIAKYQLNRAIDIGLLTDQKKAAFVIGDEEMSVWTIPDAYYDFELGLHLEA